MDHWPNIICVGLHKRQKTAQAGGYSLLDVFSDSLTTCPYVLGEHQNFLSFVLNLDELISKNVIGCDEGS
jgi:hypothetical protein